MHEENITKSIIFGCLEKKRKPSVRNPIDFVWFPLFVLHMLSLTTTKAFRGKQGLTGILNMESLSKTHGP